MWNFDKIQARTLGLNTSPDQTFEQHTKKYFNALNHQKTVFISFPGQLST